MKASPGPRYLSTLSAIARSNAYTPLSDDWGEELIMPGLDEVYVDNSLVAGNEAQIQFGTADGRYGPPLPLKVGITGWDRRSQLSGGQFDRVRFRNAVEGANAEIVAEVWGA